MNKQIAIGGLALLISVGCGLYYGMNYHHKRPIEILPLDKTIRIGK
jgi:hypothetical protein